MRVARDLAQLLGSYPASVRRIDDALEEDLPIANGYLCEMERETFRERRLSPDLHMDFADYLDRIESSHSDIMALLLQPVLRKISKISKAAIPKSSIDTMNEQIRFFSIPDSVLLACAKVMDNCLLALYNDANPLVAPLEPMVVHWVHHYYRFRPPSTICMPWVDMTKICHWPHLAHEYVHSKIFNLLENIPAKKALAKKSSDAHAHIRIDKFSKILDHLAKGSWPSIVEKWESLEKQFIKTIGKELRETYRKMYRIFHDDVFLMADRFLQSHFQEFICDLGATGIAGPSNVIHAACISADNLRNPVLGVTRHLIDLLHPPDFVRVKCQLVALSNRGLKGDKMEELRTLVEDVMMADVSEGSKNEQEKAAVQFLERYSDLLTSKNKESKSLLDEMCDLTNSLLNDKCCFDNERWKGLVSNYENYLNPESQDSQRLYPYDLVNVVWLRLAELSKTTSNYEEYQQKYAEAEPHLKTIWQKLISCAFCR